MKGETFLIKTGYKMDDTCIVESISDPIFMIEKVDLKTGYITSKNVIIVKYPDDVIGSVDVNKILKIIRLKKEII